MTIFRRAIDPTYDRGAFEEVFSRLASIKQASGQKLIDAGLAQDESVIVVRVRDDSDTRTITSVDRANIRSNEESGAFAVKGVNLPNRRGGYIEITLRREIAG